MSDLATAIELAHSAHCGQTDKLGRPYIEHPMAVMSLVHGESAKIVAALHDVVEDTDVTLDSLREVGFSAEIVASVDALTKRPNEPLEESIGRVMADSTGVAQRVKRADVFHNTDPARVGSLDEVTAARLDRKYRRTAALLGTSLEEIRATHPRW